MERWKDIPGYEGMYQVSDKGRLKRLRHTVIRSDGRKRTNKERISEGARNCAGHRYVSLSGKKELLHRLVLITWVGPPAVGYEACHGPAGVDDNSITNLYWGTRSRNMFDKRRDNPPTIRRSDGKVFANQMEAAEKTGCNQPDISLALRGKKATAGGYKWKYIN